jgi:hypothetical protein
VIIADGMLSYYLVGVTAGYFGRHDEPADDVQEYSYLIEDLRLGAALHGDLEYLRLGLEYLLAHREIDLVQFAGGTDFPYEQEQVREIIEYAWKTIWPDAPPIPSGCPPGVELVSMSLEEWWRHTGHRP